MSDQDRNLLQQLGPTSRVMYAAFEDVVGHPMPRWRILHSLFELKGATQKQLVQRLVIDPGLLTRYLKQMEQEGLVQRRADSDDNRLTYVALTEPGVALVQEAMPRRIAFFNDALAEFDTAELAVAMRILQTLEQRFRELRGQDV